MIDPKTLPTQPGVYLFKNNSGEIIYVGKAKNLRSRVSSYFRSADHSAKTIALVKNIASVDHIIVDNEVEALLLENKLIKQHTPKYNISLKDAKTFAYLVVTDETYPRLLSVRKLGKKGKYFGPYVDGSLRNELARLAISLFKLRVCKTLPKRACLNYHIGLCTAPCINNVSQEQYQQQVDAATDFLKGNTSAIAEQLAKDMHDASTRLNFEEALAKKRQLEAIHHLHERQKVDLIKPYDQHVLALQTDGTKSVVSMFTITKGVISGKKEFTFDHQDELFRSFITLYYSQNAIPHELIVNTAFWTDALEHQSLEQYLSNIRGGLVIITHPQRGDKLALVKLAEKNASLCFEDKTLFELKEALTLPDLPRVIECFDMSNLGKTALVGGMVQYVNGKPNKSQYRKFQIKSFAGKNDDFASMHEVVFRRYKRLVQENKDLPDLVLIDGGKGQLDAALTALQELGLSIPIVALAKKQEELYLPHEENPRQFDKNAPFMLLLRAIRDEVHRFAVAYNRKRREMEFKK